MKGKDAFREWVVKHTYSETGGSTRGPPPAQTPALWRMLRPALTHPERASAVESPLPEEVPSAHTGSEHAPRENTPNGLQPAPRHGWCLGHLRPGATGSGSAGGRRNGRRLLAETRIAALSPPPQPASRARQKQRMGRTGAGVGCDQVQTGALDSRAEREGAGQSRAEAINDRSRGGTLADGCFALSGLAEPTPVKKVGRRGGKMMGRKE